MLFALAANCERCDRYGLVAFDPPTIYRVADPVSLVQADGFHGGVDELPRQYGVVKFALVPCCMDCDSCCCFSVAH